MVKDKYGQFLANLIEERFDNLEAIKQLRNPLFLIHGLGDQLISYQHSVKLHSFFCFFLKFLKD